MTKKELVALEKIFEAEIHGRLPFQSKAKIYHDLVEKGMVFKDYRELKGFPPIRVEGYYLSHAGRYEYCNSCSNGPA